MTGPIVVKVGGAAVEHAGPDLWKALAEAASARPLVIVHGGGAVVDARLGAHGLTSERRGGLRLTPPEHMGVVAGALAGEVNARVVNQLNNAGARAVGLTLIDGGAVECVNANLSPGDRVGRIVRVRDAKPFVALRASGLLPVVASIGADRAGLLNINADDAAEGLAVGLGASQLVYLSDVPGVLNADGDDIPYIEVDEVEGLVADGVIAGGMEAKVRSAARAAAKVSGSVTIASWKETWALTRLLIQQGGGGTQIAVSAATSTGDQS